MNKTKIAIWAFLIGVPLAWAVLDHDIGGVNSFLMGDSTTTNKTMVFRTGASPEPTLTIDGTANDFTLNKALAIGGQLLEIGDGTTTDVVIEIDIGLGANNPLLSYRVADDAWFFKNENGVEKRIGSGGGGGKNVFNQLSNPGFEDGIAESWTASGLTPVELTGANAGNGLKSARVDCNGAGQYYEADLETFAPIIVDDFSCQADFRYKGGDALWDVKIIDGAAATIETVTLSASTDWREADSIYFNCSNLDSNQAKIRFECTGDAAQLDLEEVYLGNLTGLTEEVVPDFSSAVIDNNGASASITSQSSDSIASVNRTGVGDVTVTFKAGEFSQIPAVQLTTEGNERVTTIVSLSTTQILTTTKVQTTGAKADFPFHITLTKQGADAKSTAKIFKSIPTKADNINEASAAFSASCVLDSQTGGAIASVNLAGTGLCDITFNSIYTVVPIITTSNGDASHFATYSSLTTSGVRITTSNSAGTNTNDPFHIKILKQGADFQLPKVQPILVNQVSAGIEDGYEVFTCTVDATSGTPVFHNDTVNCDAWVDSITDQGVGTHRLNMIAGTFANVPECNCTVFENTRKCNLSASNTVTTQVEYVTYNDGTGATDSTATITCIGRR